MRDFLLDEHDRAFRAEARDTLRRELLPRAAAIEDHDDWNAVKAVVRTLGEAGYLKLMFADLYRGSLSKPVLRRPHRANPGRRWPHQGFGRAEQIYRDARALPIVGGTSEMAKYLIAVADLPAPCIRRRLRHGVRLRHPRRLR